MNLLEMCQEASDRTGIFARPSAIVGSSSDGSRLLLALSNQEGRSLRRRNNWQRLVKEKTYTSTGAAIAITIDDFDRMVPGTFWNRSSDWPIEGPASNQEWQAYQATAVGSVVERWHVRGSVVYVYPTPASGQQYALDYVTKWWCGASSDPAPSAEKFVSDTDIIFLDEDVFISGLCWRVLQAKGLDYAEAFRTYESMLVTLAGEDGGRRMLDASSGDRIYRPSAPAVPDGSWPL